MYEVMRLSFIARRKAAGRACNLLIFESKGEPTAAARPEQMDGYNASL
jgi:hypothetical protein